MADYPYNLAKAVWLNTKIDLDKFEKVMKDVFGRDVLELYFKDGLDYPEIAAYLGIRTSDVADIMKEALLYLRKPKNNCTLVNYSKYYDLMERYMDVIQENAELKALQKKKLQEKPELKIGEELYDLDLSIRSRNALLRAGIRKIAEIPTTKDDLMRIRDIGRESADEILLKMEIYYEKRDKRDNEEDSGNSGDC